MVHEKYSNQCFLTWLLLSGYQKEVVGGEGLAVVIAEVAEAVALASVGIVDFGG